MARIRTIKPEFWTAEQILDCSPITRLLFVGLWNFCDDGGNHPASLRTLKAEVFPADDFASDDIRRMVGELVENGLLVEYEAGGKQYWHVTGWRHQKIEKPSYKHPAYAPQCGVSGADEEQESENFADHSPTIRRNVADASPPEGKGKEGKGKGMEKNKGGATPKFDAAALDLPDCIRTEIWRDWIAYRRSRKLTTAEKTMRAQVDNLAEWHGKGHDPNRIIATSIANGWQGLFEPKSQAQQTTRPATGRQASIDNYAAQAAAARGDFQHDQQPTGKPESVIEGSAQRIA